MTKKIFYSLSVAAMTMLASCSQDDLGGSFKADGNEATVSVRLSTPQAISSRTFSDGSTATHLEWALYEVKADGTLAIFDNAEAIAAGFKGSDDAFSMSKEMTFKLVAGHKYGMVFWASAPTSPYTVTYTETGATMKVNYSGITANNENLDAFYAYKEISVTGDTQLDVPMYRPFAQINFGADDLKFAAEEMGYVVSSSRLITLGVYDTLDLVSGAVSNPAQRTFGYAKLPQNEPFPVPGYDYLAMTYVLVGAEQELLSQVRLQYGSSGQNPAEVRDVFNVPVRRNYRTNIYGSIITSEVELNVEIVPGYEEPDYDFPIDGVKYDASTETFSILNRDGLLWIASQVNGTSRDASVKSEKQNGYSAQDKVFVGQTVLLTSDIDMSGITWTPIGYQVNASDASISGFAGVFDGNNKTISNLYVSTEKSQNAGLFGATNDGVIKNLTLKDVAINGHYKTGAIVGDGVNVTIENCTVDGGYVTATPWLKNGVMDDANNVGGLVGYLNGQPRKSSIDNSHVKNLTVTAFRKVGGLVGVTTCADDIIPHTKGLSVTNCSVTNTSVVADMSETNYDGWATRKPDIDKLIGVKIAEDEYVTYSNLTAGDDVTVSIIKGIAQDSFNQNLAEGGDYKLSGDLTVTGTMKFTTDGVTNIDLDGNTLTIDNPSGVTINLKEGTELNFSNGTVEFTKRTSTSQADFVVEAGAKATFDKVKWVSNSNGIIAQDRCELIITDSELSSPNMMISSNANTNPSYGQDGKVHILRSKITGTTPIMVNVPMTITLEETTLYSNIQGLFVRAGEAEMIDCTININNRMGNPTHLGSGMNWSSGNTATLGAIVVGNFKDNVSYQNPAKVTLEGKTTINIDNAGGYASVTPSIHLVANEAAGKGTTFNYDPASVTINRDVALSNGYYEIEIVDGNNITINNGDAAAAVAADERAHIIALN